MTVTTFLKLRALLCIGTLLVIQTTSVRAQLDPDRLGVDQKGINIQAFLGPFGEAYVPPNFFPATELKSAASGAKTSIDADSYFFPSIYFLMSAKPNIHIKKKEQKDGMIDYEFSGVGQDLNWWRIAIRLEPVFCSAATDEVKTDPIRVLAMLPNETTENVEDQKPAAIASTAADLTTQIQPFIPASANPNNIAGATKVLFKSLFPPKAVPYSYAFVDSGRAFGWYWKRNDKPEKAESLVGLRRGIALLQVRRGVSALRVHYRIEAKWSGDYSDTVDDEYADQDTVPYGGFPRASSATFTFHDSYCRPAESKNLYDRIDYQFLKNLDDFPLVVPKTVVCRILQKDDAECNSDSFKLKTVYPKLNPIISGGKEYVLLEDLRRIVGLKAWPD